jgi:hypothetical protein
MISLVVSFLCIIAMILSAFVSWKMQGSSTKFFIRTENVAISSGAFLMLVSVLSGKHQELATLVLMVGILLRLLETSKEFKSGTPDRHQSRPAPLEENFGEKRS